MFDLRLAMPKIVDQFKESVAYGVVRASKNRLAWLLFERGLADTGGTVEVEELGLEDPDHKRYEASSWTWVRRALRRCEVRPTDVFVDFGSGKGRVVWQAAQYPFARVVGVDISPQLNEVARRNIEENHDRLTCRNVELITADATDFEVPDDMTFAYFYSPFEGKVFQGVIRSIIESVDRNPRSLTLIYANPVLDDDVRGTGRFELVEVVKGLRPDTDETSWVNIYSVQASAAENASGEEP